MGKKNVLVKKNFGQKNFWAKKFLGKKNCLIDLNLKFVLSKEKAGRVNPRWRIYGPPPPENSRAKIVLGCC